MPETNNSNWTLTGLRFPAGRKQTLQLATIYKHGRGFELKTTVNKSSSVAVRAGLELGASELQGQRPNRSATLPFRLIAIKSQIRFCCSEKQLWIKACIHVLLTNMWARSSHGLNCSSHRGNLFTEILTRQFLFLKDRKKIHLEHSIEEEIWSFLSWSV